MRKLFLCLANSYKYGGRCLAGIELERGDKSFLIVRNSDGSPHWIRPVLSQGTGEIPAEMTSGIGLFDVVEIEDIEATPHYAHSEDVIFSSMRYVQSYPRSTRAIELLCDDVHPMLLGYIEKKITPAQFQEGSFSLALIRPEHVRISCVEVVEFAKFRISFTYLGTEYNCSLTDPDYLRQLQANGIESIEREKGEMYLVVSLSHEYQGYHHKLVAGVLDMVPDILHSATLIPAEKLVKTPQQALKEYFGYDEFRPMQAEIINHIMAGKDCLVLMPTGGGKSVCFQIPALLKEGLTIVVSPLISLMKDQVESLRSNGIAAVALNSAQDRAEDYEIRKQLSSGQVKLLYISPERILTEIKGLFAHIKVNLIAIDEAHCISQWGHDFRPEYSQLGELRDLYPDIPVAAFTATADKVTRQDIVEQLRLKEPRIFISSFDRPNLSLDVRCGLSSNDKFRTILSLIERHRDESGIIYCLARHTTEELAKKLCSKGINAAAYHAALLPQERGKVQDDFQNDRIKVVCATIAFGMGIDKSNVRFVAHYNLPKNIESYYQEIGRGGRDGLPCETILFYNIGDLSNLRSFCDASGQSELMHSKLDQMSEYAEAHVCRRRILLNYFHETMDLDCGNCDVCRNPPVRFDGTILIQKALSAIARCQEQIGLKTVIHILRGQDTAEIRQNRYDRLKTYGMGRDLSYRDWNDYLIQMFQLGYYEVDHRDGNRLKITELGHSILHGSKKAMLAEIKREDLSVKGRKKRLAEEAKAARQASLERNEQQQHLLLELRTLRQHIAEQEQKVLHTVFSDKTLGAILDFRPITMSAMNEIPGISRSKLLKYGIQLVLKVRSSEGLPVIPDGEWDKLPTDILAKITPHITCQGIRYDFDPELYAAFPWSDTVQRFSKICYWNLWKESVVPLSDFVSAENPLYEAIVARFCEIALRSWNVKIEDGDIHIPIRIEYDADGNPVETLSCSDFDDGLHQLTVFLERERHFPFRRTSAYECSLLRWYHEVSRGVIKLTFSQQQALDKLNDTYKDFPRHARPQKEQNTERQ